MKKSQLNAIYWSYRKKEVKEMEQFINDVIIKTANLCNNVYSYAEVKHGILFLNAKYLRNNYKRAIQINNKMIALYGEDWGQKNEDIR